VLPSRLSAIRSDTRIILTFCMDKIRHEFLVKKLYYRVELIEDF
jgi:hypothetical protein